MALIFADSFDHYEVSSGAHVLNGKWETITAERRNGRHGTYGARGVLLKNLQPQTTLILGLAVFLDYESESLNGVWVPVGQPSRGGFGFTVYNDSQIYCKLGLGSDGRMRVTRGAYPGTNPQDGGGSYFGGGLASVLWTSSAPVWKFSQWNYVEWKIVAATDNTGSFVVRLNGEEIANVTGVRTVPFAQGDDPNDPQYYNPENFTQFTIDSTLGTNAYDDLYVLNAADGVNDDFLGDLYVDALLPDGAGVDSDSTIVGTTPQPTRWQSVRIADGAVSAVQFSATSDADSYTFDDLPYPDATVYGVQVVAQARKEDSGFARMTLTNSYDDSPTTTTDASPTLLTPSAGDVYAFRTATLDESAKGAWTYQDVQDAQFGVRREALP
jgi:hypothetical protein